MGKEGWNLVAVPNRKPSHLYAGYVHYAYFVELAYSSIVAWEHWSVGALEHWSIGARVSSLHETRISGK